MNTIPVFGVESSVPAMCALLSLTEIYSYDDPRMGVGFKYEGPDYIHADAYLYDLGLPHITDDIKSPEVISWFKIALAEIFKFVELGEYKNFTMAFSDFFFLEQNKSNPFCLLSSFIYEATITDASNGNNIICEMEQMSHLTLRTDRGFINKIRFSYPREVSHIGIKVFRAFLLDWTTAVQNFHTVSNNGPYLM